jgi:hypothetical protein
MQKGANLYCIYIVQEGQLYLAFLFSKTSLPQHIPIIFNHRQEIELG